MGLQRFERRLERLVEGVFGRALRSGLQPVEVARKLTRELDVGRTRGVHGLIAPNQFRIVIALSDRDRFASFEEALLAELADAAREHARDEGYHFVGPIQIEFAVEPNAVAGSCEVQASIVAGESGRSGAIVLGDGRRVILGDRAVIGRHPECEVPLGDPEVSRRHAEVVLTPEGFAVHDLGSTNGTLVNSSPVREERLLTDGDEIRVGATALRFEAS